MRGGGGGGVVRVVISDLIINKMKITVKIDNIEITVDEQGQNERTVTMKYSDQNESELLKCEDCEDPLPDGMKHKCHECWREIYS